MRRPALVEIGVDRAHAVSYLETDKRQNVAFCQRLGFEVSRERVLGTPTWYMRRPGA